MRDRPGADGPAEADPDGRAVDGPVALLVKEVFGIIRQAQRRLGLTILLVRAELPHGAVPAPATAYIMENGKVVLAAPRGPGANEDVKDSPRGAGEQRRSFKN